MVRGEGGFGIVTVMAGAVVLGIFALVYTRQMQNRANISMIGDLMAFREQVMTYYSSVVSNRSTWECTIQSNEDLRRYLATGTGTFTAANDPDGNLAIYDYTGDCQEGYVGTTVSELLVGSGGLALKLDQDHSSLPVSPARAADDCKHTEDDEHFCLTVEWEALDPDQEQRRGVEVKLILEANREAIKKQLDVSFDLKDKEHAIYFNRTVATDCSDGRVTGHFPGSSKGPARSWDSSFNTTAPHMTGTGVNAYAGDAAVVSFDSITGLVSCSGRGPLVIPPCYDMTDKTQLHSRYVNPFVSGTGMPGLRGFRSSYGFTGITGSDRIGLQCDGSGTCCEINNTAVNCSSNAVCVNTPAGTAIKGRCPETGGSGTTAIAYFDPHTGISQCSNPNILVEKIDTSAPRNVERNCEDDDDHYGVVLIRGKDAGGEKVGTFQCSSDYWSSGTARGGVEPGPKSVMSSYPCDLNYAIGYFKDTNEPGEVGQCVAGKNAQSDTPPGFPGPRGERGDVYSGPQGPRPVSKCRSGYSRCTTHSPSPNLQNPTDYDCPTNWSYVTGTNECNPP